MHGPKGGTGNSDTGQVRQHPRPAPATVMNRRALSFVTASVHGDAAPCDERHASVNDCFSRKSVPATLSTAPGTRGTRSSSRLQLSLFAPVTIRITFCQRIAESS